MAVPGGRLAPGAARLSRGCRSAKIYGGDGEKKNYDGVRKLIGSPLPSIILPPRVLLTWLTGAACGGSAQPARRRGGTRSRGGARPLPWAAPAVSSWRRNLEGGDVERGGVSEAEGVHRGEKKKGGGTRLPAPPVGARTCDAGGGAAPSDGAAAGSGGRSTVLPAQPPPRRPRSPLAGGGGRRCRGSPAQGDPTAPHLQGLPVESGHGAAFHLLPPQAAGRGGQRGVGVEVVVPAALVGLAHLPQAAPQLPAQLLVVHRPEEAPADGAAVVAGQQRPSGRQALQGRGAGEMHVGHGCVEGGVRGWLAAWGPPAAPPRRPSRRVASRSPVSPPLSPFPRPPRF